MRREASSQQSFYGWWIVGAAFVFMMMIVGFVLYGLPQFFPNYIAEFGWRRDQIQLGNTLSKIIVGPLFGFAAGWAMEKYGPRRVMLVGALFAGIALVGFSGMSSLSQLYLFYFFNALGYLCAGPLPAQVLTWGSDDLDPALLAQLNDNPRAAAVAAAPGPIAQLVQYLVQGIAEGISGIVRGTVVIVGTTAYVGLAFTGGVITTVGDILPGPIGNLVTNIGEATTNVANTVAEALRVGPYGTVSA